MQDDATLIRRYEPLVILTLTGVYALRRLLEEADGVNGINTKVEVAQHHGASTTTILQDLASYNHNLNNNLPLLAGLALALVAWTLFHGHAIPAFQQQARSVSGWTYTVLTGILLVLSAYAHHRLKLHVRFRLAAPDVIIGLKVFSLYRPRTVVFDAVALAVLLGLYELLFQLADGTRRRMAAQLEPAQRLLRFLPLVGLGITLLGLAMNVHLPPTSLWAEPFPEFWFGAGLLLLGFLVQQIAYNGLVTLGPRRWKLGLPPALLLAAIVLTMGLFSIYLAAREQPLHARPMLALSLMVVVTAVVLGLIRKLLSQEKTTLQTQVSAASAELSSLRAQINPHFLFNTLNSLYASALRENSEKTADGIQKLGDMMRFMLHENHRDSIPLEKEVEYLHHYIDLQRLRIDESHPVEIRVNLQVPDRPISLAPMLLTPLVENAFKHGISFRRASWISVTLTFDDRNLYFKVHNSRHARSDADPERLASGVGLDNVRKRLQLLYPGRHQFTIQVSEQDYFVSLVLGISRPSSVGSADV